MRCLSCYTANGATDPLIKEYPSPNAFWGDWNGLMGYGMWHRTEQAPDGSPYTVKWKSKTFRNGAGKWVVSTTSLWADGEHPADTRPPAPPQTPRPEIPKTQAGRLSTGERLRSPHGTWTVAEWWIADKPGAQGKDRKYGATSVRGDSHMYYLLTHEDGHQEEWSAPDMADADFHRILPDEQQTLT
jgi:hypothetical protein